MIAPKQHNRHIPSALPDKTDTYLLACVFSHNQDPKPTLAFREVRRSIRLLASRYNVPLNGPCHPLVIGESAHWAFDSDHQL